MTRIILTCSPHFTEMALNEVRRNHPETSLLQLLSHHHLLLQTHLSFNSFTAPWRQRLPIYLHHAFPLRETLPLTGTLDDLMQMARTGQHIAPQEAGLQVQIAIERQLPYSTSDVEAAIGGVQTPASPHAPSGSILSILITENESGLNAYFGVSYAEQNISPWAGGALPVLEPVSNRAGYKLLEALSTFEINLRRGENALDLGAAPGAWTTLLRRRGMRVTAVAPTPMYPWLRFDPDVTYYPMLAEDFLDCCPTTFDLIVNDMWLDVRDSARLMLAYSRHLHADGIAIMTLKLHGRNTQRNMDHAYRILRKAYKIIRVRQLVSNRKEVTLFLRRKATNVSS